MWRSGFMHRVGRETMGGDIRLVVFDMEGTLTADPTVWEIMHLKNGTWESHGLPYWEQYRAGGMHYDEFARKDVATWAGAPVARLDEAVEEVPLMPGCVALLTLLRERGVRTAIVSNGLECLGRRLVRDFGIDRVAANRRVASDGHLTGGLDLLVPHAEKGDIMRRIADELGVPLASTMAVGDGVADIAMFESAGVSVAFRAENDDVARAADHIVPDSDLRQIIPLLTAPTKIRPGSF